MWHRFELDCLKNCFHHVLASDTIQITRIKPVHSCGYYFSKAGNYINLIVDLSTNILCITVELQILVNVHP